MATHFALVLVLVVVLFPAIRRRLSRGMWVAVGALCLFLIVVTISQST